MADAAAWLGGQAGTTARDQRRGAYSVFPRCARDALGAANRSEWFLVKGRSGSFMCRARQARRGALLFTAGRSRARGSGAERAHRSGRLHEVRVEAGLARAAPVFVLAPAGERDQHMAPCPRLPRGSGARLRSHRASACRCRAARRRAGTSPASCERLGAIRRRIHFVAVALQQRAPGYPARPDCRRRAGCDAASTSLRDRRVEGASHRSAARLAASAAAGARGTRCPGRARRCAPRRCRRASRRAAARARARCRARPARDASSAVHLRESSKSRGSSSGANADAVVAHARTRTSVADRARTVSAMRPPGSVYLAALLSRLPSTCVRRVRSPSTCSVSSGTSTVELVPLLGDQRLHRLDRARDDRRSTRDRLRD